MKKKEKCIALIIGDKRIRENVPIHRLNVCVDIYADKSGLTLRYEKESMGIYLTVNEVDLIFSEMHKRNTK